MEDIFAAKALRPMLIGKTAPPYDDPGSLFELKLDGERCLAYLDKDDVTLVNRRGASLLPRLPELAEIHRQVGARCVLDGEVITGVGGKADFEAVRSRLAGHDPLRTALAAKQAPASLVVFDILYHRDAGVMLRPLEERKELLRKTVADSPRMAVARTVEAQGRAFYQLVLKQGLEGVVGKRKDSLYRPGKRTNDWVKVKNTLEDDYVICGYIPAAHVASLILGQYNARGRLVYKGRATLGLHTDDFHQIQQAPRAGTSPLDVPMPQKAPGAVWLVPTLVCTVYFMHKTAQGGLRQPHYRRLRPDKAPGEAVEAV